MMDLLGRSEVSLVGEGFSHGRGLRIYGARILVWVAKSGVTWSCKQNAVGFAVLTLACIEVSGSCSDISLLIFHAWFL